MVRFSCFNTHSSKPKKPLQPSFEAYHKTLADSARGHVSEGLLNKMFNSQGATQGSDGIKHTFSADCGLKLEDMKSKFITESEFVPTKGQLKKSQSLGTGLYQEGMVSVDEDIVGEIYLGFSCDGSVDHSGIGTSRRYGEVSPPYHEQIAPTIDTCQVNSEIIDNNTIFSIGDDQFHSETERKEDSTSPVSDECVADFTDHILRTPRGIVKSSSMPTFGAAVGTPNSRCSNNLGPRSRSFEDLRVSDTRWKDVLIHEMETVSVEGQEEYANTSKAEKAISENYGDDNYDSCHYSCLAKDWVMPAVKKVDTGKSVHEETALHQWVELPNNDFKIKRINEWVTDLEHCVPLEEMDEPLNCDDVKGDSTLLSGLASAKMGDKVSLGMEVAKRYISTLSAVATTAHLANHGLVAIPFLSAFVSLRVLNMSGNAIMRITAGALPRGLHTLNLSKNNISTIEGLRELSRLRILDLSYNRILRIGHGLASCSSLKELYLAGNKISEVEGLHRLLKLSVLDLRFNKISTAKCLGQLAANYNSLQAISLEGNPAQKNVGDDQLKKYLLGLLPHLAYFNRQTIKVGTLKDSSERSVRLGMSSHQFDRGVRPDHKVTRKSGHVVVSQRQSSLSAHGRGSQAAASPKLTSKSRHSRLPPTGTKGMTSNRQQHNLDFGSRIMNLRQELSAMRRSRSEGTLESL